jgi:hypothetical protein
VASVGLLVSPQRVLIDCDFSAHGIWKISSPEERSAPPPAGKWGPAPAQPDQPRPWSTLLSTELLDALQEWNDTGEGLFGGRGPLPPKTVGPKVDAFWRLAAELAERTQQELGPGYEVLYIVPGGAWRWVTAPALRR